MWTVELPIQFKVGVRKPKTITLGMNWYRNAPFHQLSDMKIKFAELVTPRLTNIPIQNKIRISYYLFMNSAHKADVANICSIVDKFFCDTLVSAGKLPDDNLNHLPMVAFCYGGLDKGNGRVEALIEPIEE